LIQGQKKDVFPRSRPASCAGGELSAEDFELFRSLIYSSSGITLSQEKVHLLRNRLAKLLRQGSFTSYRDYYDHITADKSGQELIRLIDRISTNLTYFFREPKHFQLLKSSVLPVLVEEKRRKGERRLRVWSAACSTGEEPYSLLMTVLPFLEPLSAWDFRLLGSDISTQVLAKAKAGIYSKNQIKGQDALIISRFFEKSPSGLIIKPSLKRYITFARINLQEPFPVKGPFDLIFCRNVMIYFDQETRERLINRFFEVLAPGGHLFIGHSENLTGLKHNFKYVCPAVYRK
jgi:chemotaxis protein methyltransferase CheR